MKNRKKILLPNRAVSKRSDSNIDKNPLEKPSNKKIFASISLQQNLEFFQRQANLCRPLFTGGDADTYFKHTLRNYNHFDFNLLQKATQQYKVSKSSESLKKKKSVPSLKQRRHLHQKSPTKTRSTTADSRRSVTLKEKVRPVTRKEPEEVDLDIFYSPSSQTLTSARDSTHTLTNNQLETKAAVVEAVTEEKDKELEEDEKADSNEKPQLKMAEEEEYENENEYEEEEEEVNPAYVEGEETEDEDEPEEEEEEAKEVPEGQTEPAEQPPTEGPTPPEKEPGDGSIFEFNPKIDSAVLQELEEAERQAKATAQTILDLKQRVTELLKKEKHSEGEARELEQKNRELKTQMAQFEEKTRRIQCLLKQTNLFEKMIPCGGPLQRPHGEDVLPKVVVCGVTENNIPKLILCDEKKRQRVCKPPCEQVMPKITKRLNDSYTLQERLAKENADLEGKRYKLQSDLVNKDQTIESLQRKLCSIQCEMRLMSQENTVLNDKIQQIYEQKPPCEKMPRKVCGKNKGTCPADIETRLHEYSETTKVLESQLCDMECDVKAMQSELSAVQTEREHLEQHKKVLVCPPVCAPPPCPPCSPCIIPFCDQKLRELREQYSRLQDDYKSKLTEVAGLRTDNEKLKNAVKEGENSKTALQLKLKELEITIKDMRGDKKNGSMTKEHLIELEQQLQVSKQRFREAQDELEELRSFLQEQTKQMEDYRNKYLEAQQEVEEQKRQIDILEMDGSRMNEQVTLEIQRLKNTFQEKMQELLPLPDKLKSLQIQLQETQKMHLLAERNCDALTKELEAYKKQIEDINDKLKQAETDSQAGTDENISCAAQLEQAKKKIEELEEECARLKIDLTECREHFEEATTELQGKLHEIAQLEAQLDSVREECARQVARNKERCETVRRSMQNQICDLERQLALSRAQARCAQKDRDEIRQKMQMQINNLYENFEDAQMRIRSLQGHVNFLKESYNSKCVTETLEIECEQNDPCICGMEF